MNAALASRSRADGATGAAFVVLWMMLDGVAAALESTRGERGLIVLAVVLAAAAAAELLLSGGTWHGAAVKLGVRAPERRSLQWTVLVVAGMLGFVPLFGAATGSPLGIRADAALLAVGILAQGGLAEELVFRGFLYRRLREHRSQAQATWFATFAFVAAHMPLFFTLPWAVALAALALAAAMAVPLARLFEQAGGSIWPPAILHATAQGGLKLVDGAEPQLQELSIAWMALCAIAPWFLVRQLARGRP